jgi:hypothetical protein
MFLDVRIGMTPSPWRQPPGANRYYVSPSLITTGVVHAQVSALEKLGLSGEREQVVSRRL